MKKNLKKMITMILALMMLIAMPITVFAADETTTETNAVVMTDDEAEANDVNADNTKGDKAFAAAIAVGISAAAGAIAMGWAIAKSAEGISRPIPVEYNINKWADNMKSYLVSAMSYTDSKNLKEFAENTELIVNLSGDKSFRK